jgi:osmotically-inducible protein OsmY
VSRDYSGREAAHRFASEQTSFPPSSKLFTTFQLWSLRMKPDSKIQQDVMAELNWEPSVNAAHIGVEVTDGVVTLAGHVGSYAEKLGAENAAQRVAGVKAITVEMDVKLAETSQRTDSDIAQSAENILRWTSYVPAHRVKIKVEKGCVTLSGDVEWEFQRNAAVSAVRNQSGVTGVTDLITIKPEVSASIVKSEIEAALKRGASRDAKSISVEVSGSDVTLTGIVNSWSERQRAKDSAWSTPGVRNVRDNLTVTF